MSTQSINPLLGKADTILASLDRQSELSPTLRIEIEEAVETAWEIAFRKPIALKVCAGSDIKRLCVSLKDRNRADR